MLHAETAALPFPPGFFFDDVDDQVLDHEADVSTQGHTDAWGDYMAKMLTGELAPAQAG